MAKFYSLQILFDLNTVECYSILMLQIFTLASVIAPCFQRNAQTSRGIAGIFSFNYLII